MIFNYFNKIKQTVFTPLFIFQLLLSSFAAAGSGNQSAEFQNINETILTNNINLYNEAWVNNKTSVSEKVLTSQKLLNENFYNCILKIAEECGFLFFINSRNNPNNLISVFTELTIPRSPPLT